ncbi:hypothetical protein [Phytomonospora endophytica]|uniref:TFIIS-type domain-containing protein n=1 Tax=Phytomonospora endophytica TaxID=714109 RepID=A0A841FP36_9ACTN|nr:hypothetical protein [Phytomonospora endophytica]MBB6034997.1 hypothetical protein [Phytomonospora endophytica]GIG71438.1 hypothetical protein Pen01_77330 [Phytomonospora endophytica]
MAPARKCPECRYVMYVQGEKYEPRGTWVVYVCQNKTCPSAQRNFPYKEKVFVGS